MLPPKIQRQLAQRQPQSMKIEPTEENRKLYAEYLQLAQEINDVPARLRGIGRNFRRRDWDTQRQRLLDDRDEKLKKLLVMEKQLGFKT